MGDGKKNYSSKFLCVIVRGLLHPSLHGSPIRASRLRGRRWHVLATGLRHMPFRRKRKGTLTRAMNFRGPVVFLLWGRSHGRKSLGQGDVPTQSPHTLRPLSRCPGPWNSLPTSGICTGLFPRNVSPPSTYTSLDSQSGQALAICRACGWRLRCEGLVYTNLRKDKGSGWKGKGLDHGLQLDVGLPCTTEIRKLSIQI